MRIVNKFYYKVVATGVANLGDKQSFMLQERALLVCLVKQAPTKLLLSAEALRRFRCDDRFEMASMLSASVSKDEQSHSLVARGVPTGMCAFDLRPHRDLRASSVQFWC